MMNRPMMIAAAGAALLLAGCAGLDAPSGPPIAGTEAGPGAPPLQQLVARQPHSTNASDGAAVIAGAKGDGKPGILRAAPPPGSLGAAPGDIAGFPVVGPPDRGGA